MQQGHVPLPSSAAAEQCQGLASLKQNRGADVGQLFWGLKLTLQHDTCRAFALEGRGIWHALSASVAQQLIGPVRIRADFRFALDLPSSIPQVSSTPAAAAHHRMAPGRQQGRLQCIFPAHLRSHGVDVTSLPVRCGSDSHLTVLFRMRRAGAAGRALGLQLPAFAPACWRPCMEQTWSFQARCCLAPSDFAMS